MANSLAAEVNTMKDEYVNKQEIVNTFEKLSNIYFDRYNETSDEYSRARALAYTTAADIVASYTSETISKAQGWISVDDRLPEAGEQVLVYVAIKCAIPVGFWKDKIGTHEIRIGWLEDKKWALQFCNMEYSEVLYWMPLPHKPMLR